MEKEYPKMQSVMNEAYDLFAPNMGIEDFWLRLNFPQRIAVFIGNLNYQVENGGFLQWHGNGYSKCTNDIIRILQTVGNCDPIIKLVQKASKLLRNSDDEPDGLDELDTQFYQHNESMLDNVEKYLLAVA